MSGEDRCPRTAPGSAPHSPTGLSSTLLRSFTAGWKGGGCGVPMLSASSRRKPSRSATTNAHAIIMGARFTTVYFVLMTCAYTQHTHGLSSVLCTYHLSARPPCVPRASCANDTHFGPLRRGLETHLLVENLIELEAAVRVALLARLAGQQVVVIVVPLSFPLGLSLWVRGDGCDMPYA